MAQNDHFVLVTFPAQGHINPTLQFARNLIHAGVSHVTFVTSVSAHRHMLNKDPNCTYPSITFAPFSDGYDDGLTSHLSDPENFFSEFKRRSKQAITDLVITSDKKVTCLIYALLLPWVEEVARDLKVPSALLWIQPAFVFDVYYYYFNGYKQVLTENNEDPSYSVNLPGLPVMTSRDLPSFFLSSSPHATALSIFEELFQVLGQSRDHEQTKKPRVFVNTFDALENDALKALNDKVEFMAIGPLIPSAFLDGEDISDTQFGADMFGDANNCSEWLNSSTEKASVIYVSFGSLAVLRKRQIEEIAKGLLETGRPFLWVIAKQQKDNRTEEKEDGAEYLESLIQRINSGRQGLIVQWSSQLQVLTHGSIGCFVSHCGWNSTLESIVAGVPMVAFPQWSDQGCNAKLIEDVWRIGVRVRESEVEGSNMVKSEEIKRCIEMVMGSNKRSVQIRRNVEELRNLAKKALGDGGSSKRSLVSFLKEMDRHRHLQGSISYTR